MRQAFEQHRHQSDSELVRFLGIHHAAGKKESAKAHPLVGGELHLGAVAATEPGPEKDGYDGGVVDAAAYWRDRSKHPFERERPQIIPLLANAVTATANKPKPRILRWRLDSKIPVDAAVIHVRLIEPVVQRAALHDEEVRVDLLR
ncbi:hypothetical protein [Rhodococcus sp. RDE2]|uniref:hypothetical protein n=1 Tax=Rhodococcus sp. RDE2 TaxID=2885078 RepID=UPI001E2BDDE0|nr:hypothetical protein [Rhodococcus sp. RDE2]BDB61751.1 hypothetical protein RDE2_35450 [Rhodococcus sp. RDE2]